MTLGQLADRFWATDSWSVGAKMSRWNDTVATHMTELHVDAAQPESFKASWTQTALGPIDLNVLGTTPQIVRRTPEMTRSTAEGSYEIVYMQRGSMIVRECGDEQLIRQGDFGILRNTVPYEFECPRENVALSIHVSQSWMDKWLRDPEGLRRMPWQARSQWGTPLASLLRLIAANGVADCAVPRDVIADQIGSLFALIGQNASARCVVRTNTFNRVEALLDRLFADPDLSPDQLAREAGISKRHLHGLFAGQGTTFGAQLIERRLQYAADRLSAGSLDPSSVGDIAFEAGFSDPSHFARRFRQRFGCAPSAWRNGRRPIGPKGTSAFEHREIGSLRL